MSKGRWQKLAWGTSPTMFPCKDGRKYVAGDYVYVQQFDGKWCLRFQGSRIAIMQNRWDIIEFANQHNHLQRSAQKETK